ncbi:MAG: recombinase family protein [Acidobacteria bacterium]|nr:recombinase family protein [Acidobacteriota bacterium]
MMRGGEKIRKEQLSRVAYVYVRQSTELQVRQNRQSQERQYGLVDLAQKLGWHPESVVVIDEDLGHTADGTERRDGFDRLRAEVCQGKVGLILSLETTRLARTNREWYHLLDLCGVSRTLVGDLGGLYDPRDSEDRLNLGLKGILGEWELHVLKTRLTAGLHHKAQKGELVTRLPVGFVRDLPGKIVMDPEESVRHALEMIFCRFEELGAARRVHLWMLSEGLKIPKREGGGVMSEVVWITPRYSSILNILKNPCYAGAYVWGKRQSYVRLEGDQPRHATRGMPMNAWKVLIPQAHAGYLSWEQYLENQKRICGNWNGGPRGGAANRGRALVQGIIRCGRCGKRMRIAYRRHERHDGRQTESGSYMCESTQEYGQPLCQSVSAELVDRVVKEAFFEAIQPAELDVTIERLKQLGREQGAAERHWQLRLERAGYDIDLSRRRYKAVDPENRGVARTLESEWEQGIRQKEILQKEYETWKGRQRAWTEQELSEVRELIQDVRGLWESQTTTHEDRKELVRLLVEETWVRKDVERKKVEVRILWRGETQTRHEVADTERRSLLNAERLRWLKRWAEDGCDDSEIARRMRERGWESYRGLPFTVERVSQLRRFHRIRSRWAEVQGLRTIADVAREMGVTSPTVRRWIREGLLTAERRARTIVWVRLTPDDIKRVRETWDVEDEWSVPRVAAHLKVGPTTVYRWLSRGAIRGRRIRVGCKRRWVIPKKSLEQAGKVVTTTRPRATGGAS